jgi:hypothetical protein
MNPDYNEIERIFGKENDAERGKAPRQASAFILVENRVPFDAGFISCATEKLAIQQVSNGDGVKAIYEIFEDGTTREMTVVLEGKLRLVPKEEN